MRLMWIRPFLSRASRHFVTHWRPWTLFAISVVLATSYLYGRPYILYNDSDPLTYFTKAWWYLGRDGGVDVPSRGPGYPVWLILTGAASFDVWWGLMASQVAMAVAAPVLAYGILSPLSRNAGFAAGLLFMLFGISYQHMNWVMTEELFLFVELLSFLMISRYFAGAWAKLPKSTLQQQVAPHRSQRWHRFLVWLSTPYPITLLLAYCTMVKPAGSLFFWLFIGVCLLFRVESSKRYLGPITLYVAIMMTWGTHHYLFSPVRFSPYGMPQSQIQRNFADVYYGNDFSVVNGWVPVDAVDKQPVKTAPPTIRAEDGVASRRLHEAVLAMVAMQRRTGQWNIADPNSIYQLYERYGSNEQIAEVIFLRPNPFYYSLIVQAAAPVGGDELLHDVAREHNNTGLLAYAKYLMRHPTVPLMGPTNSYVGYHFFSKFYRYREFLTTGQQGLRDIFIRPLRDNLIQGQYGHATQSLVTSLRFFMTIFPQMMGAGDDYVKDFGSKEGFEEYVLTNPYHDAKYTGSMMGWIFNWLIALYGEEQMGNLMGRAGAEIALNHPAGPGFLIGDYFGALAYYAGKDFVATTAMRGFGPYFAGFRNAQEARLAGTVESGRNARLPGEMPNAVGKEKARSELGKTLNAAMELQYSIYKWAKPLFFFLTIMFALPLILFGTAGRLVTFLLLCYFSSAATWVVAMIMPGSDPRHEEVFAFISLLISILGITASSNFWRISRMHHPLYGNDDQIHDTKQK